MRRSIWTIRRTMIAVVLVVSLALAAAFNYLWMPRITTVMVEAQSSEVERQLDVIIDALLPFLLSRQYGAIHETLTSIKARNVNWVDVRLVDANGRQLYPLQQVDLSPSPQTIRLQREISMRGSSAGRIEAVVDISAHLARLAEETERLGRAATAAILLLMTLVTVTIDRMVIHRVKLLGDAADQMAQGNFTAKVPDSRADEVGHLTDSFSAMRQQIAQQTSALKAARQEAEAALQAKSQFLARMSHEIRTPLNGVIPVAALLSEADMDPVHKQQVEIIKESGKALLSIVDDILDLSKFEEGRLELQKEPVSIKGLIVGVVRILSISAEKKGLKLRAEIAGDLHNASIVGDEDRLRQVLINLAGNAIKFTQNGSVTIKADPGKVGQMNCVTFSVCDTGIGIAVEDHDRIFERFEQAEGGRNRRFGGSGLGLAISQSLIEAHGSQIDVTSTPGQGSTFSFSLVGQILQDTKLVQPLKQSECAPVLDSFSGARALIVDDNATNRFVAKAIMKRMGFEVDLAENGFEAVQTVGQTSYDVVLMDMHMPQMDGLEATRRIRAMDGPQKGVRIIALSASVLSEDLRKCENAGMDGFVAKPLSAMDLRAALTV
ncbi:ATP-binding protein [Primorskyibacter sp. 2E233]|uniref:ATP-binding protein n=1 Tax=Primorskyibacter sp. 2E233 TaxID=3413431 RepID=UPI003BF1D175